jgi:hypothetical protein
MTLRQLLAENSDDTVKSPFQQFYDAKILEHYPSLRDDIFPNEIGAVSKILIILLTAEY